jgi:hypothetical protein
VLSGTVLSGRVSARRPIPGERTALIAGQRGIDLLTPGVDAARHILHLRELLPSQPEHDLLTAAPVVAMHHDPLVAVRLQLGQALTELAHGNQPRLLNMDQRMFVRFAHIQKQKVFAAVQHLLDGGDVDFQRQRVRHR